MPRLQTGTTTEFPERYQEDRSELFENYDEAKVRRDLALFPNHPFTTKVPYADIHRILRPDILHQLQKGVFQYHLVNWVLLDIKMHHKHTGSSELNRRLRATPVWAGRRQFKTGLDFSKWTARDSKDLAQIFIPAITGLVSDEMLNAWWR